MKRSRGSALVIGALVLGAVVVPSSAMPAVRAPVPGTTCEVFGADNVWHMDVSRLPTHPKSRVWKRSSNAGSTDLHPDFGPPSYGIPFDVVDASHADVSVRFDYARESDLGPYPFGAGTTIEGGSDRHALMVDRDTCTLYELFGARWNGGQPQPGAVRSSTSARTHCAPPGGRVPMRLDCRSSPGSCGGTRCRPARSTTRSGSRSPVRADATCGRLAIRPG